jgi:hypothetical protein
MYDSESDRSVPFPCAPLQRVAWSGATASEPLGMATT